MPSPQLPENQASLAARLPSELLLTGLATTSDAVVVVSPQSRVVLYNAAAEELFGYPADEALGEPFEQLGNEIARQLVALGSSNGGSAAPAGGPGRASLLTGTRKDGSRFEATARLAPVATPDGVFRLLSLRPRVSPSAVAELSLLKAIAIAIGASEDLPAALELTLQQIGDFAGCAAGESWIPDPAGDTLLRGPVWARGGEELLSFHRASKSFTFQRGQGLPGRTWQSSQAVITCDPLPRVRADAVQIAQVFHNLIANALKFRGNAAPRIHLSARREVGHWILSCRDNGIGIAEDYYERIFIIFQRLHTREEYPGTGIGLSICKKIIERHGGLIWVESEPGQGSVFFFSLPTDKRANGLTPAPTN